MPFKTWFVCIFWTLCAQFPASAQAVEPWFATALKREPLLTTTPAPAELPTLAVIDDGVWCNSPSLTGVTKDMTKSKSFVTDNNFCSSDAGHGTKVASIAAAVAKNRLSLVSLRAFSGPGPFYDPRGLSAALQQITDWPDGFVVVNASTITAPGQNLFEAVKSLKDKALVVAAAGNNHSKQIQALCIYAGQLPNVICVGASDQTGNLWVDSETQGSNYGPGVDLAAYGANMYAVHDSGTSWAAPVVSGLALLVYQNLQALGYKPTPALLKQILIAGSCDDDSLKGLLANAKLACGENLLATAQKAMARWEAIAVEPLFFGKDPVENQVATIAVSGGELPLSQLNVEMRFRSSDTGETVKITPLGISRDSENNRDLVTFTAPSAGRYWLSFFIEGMIDTVETSITVANPRTYHLAEGTLGTSAEMPAGPGQEISVLMPGTKIPQTAEAWIKLSQQGEPDDWHQLVFESATLTEDGYVEARFQLPSDNYPEFEGQNSLVLRLNGEFVQTPLTIFLSFPPPKEE